MHFYYTLSLLCKIFLKFVRVKIADCYFIDEPRFFFNAYIKFYKHFKGRIR